MKVFMMGIAMLFASSSFAAESPEFLKQFWNSKYEIVDTLFKNYGRGEGNIPNTGVSTKHQTHYVKIFNVCSEGDYIRTINPIKTCAKRGYKEVRCDDDKKRSANGKCYDRDEKVCTKYVMQYGVGAIKTQKKTCAKSWSKEGREWRRKNGDKKFKDDYPKCSVFTTYTSTRRTKYNFDIVKNVNKRSSSYDNRYKGDLVMNVDIEFPACTSGYAGK